MNRKQAENILDAYVLLSTSDMEAASSSLREVIVDAMTIASYYPLTISSPKVTPTMPTVEPYKPTITWKSEVETGPMCANGAGE